MFIDRSLNSGTESETYYTSDFLKNIENGKLGKVLSQVE